MRHRFRNFASQIAKLIETILLLFIAFILILSGCNSDNARLFNKSSSERTAPSGKYRNPTIFSTVNPFQGRAKSRLSNSKRKKFKLMKRKHKQKARYRKAPKPGRTFGMKRSVSRGRLKSSGSRMNKSSGGGKKNRNLFNTRK